MGCELSCLNDTFWNRESISGSDESFGYENATAIAYALKELLWTENGAVSGQFE